MFVILRDHVVGVVSITFEQANTIVIALQCTV